ncbi:MAG: hypothetical protein P8R31_14985 [Mariniblastus sp.]|nr:hypothetical protein [Mariniblastus sp.]
MGRAEAQINVVRRGPENSLVIPLMEHTVVSVSDDEQECYHLQTEIFVFDGGSALRFLALLALALSITFLCSPSLNGGLGDWLSTAPLMTRWIAIAITAISLSIFAINAVGIRPKDLSVRTWRFIGFVATTAACGVLMVTMTMYAIRTNSVPDWLPILGLVLFLIGGIGWVHFYARQNNAA